MRNNPEAAVQHAIRLACGSQPGVVLYRNSQLKYKVNGQWVVAGLGAGTPDLVGFVSVKITPEMVGQTIARAIGIEVKRPGGGVVSPKQELCKAMWESHGAVAVIVDNVEDALAALEGARRGDA